MRVHISALRHGLTPDEAIFAATNWTFASELDEENPAREFRLGFDSAMKARRKDWSLLES